jgi:hypothetical protein
MKEVVVMQVAECLAIVICPCCKCIITKSEKYVALKLSSSVSKDKANKLRNQRKFEILCGLNLKYQMMQFNKKPNKLT